jgi:dihydropteroate synthase
MDDRKGTLRFLLRGRVYDFSSRTHLMGILNVTPDSFSDGGRFFDFDRAVARGREMAAQGADILDIGGESTRPGADAVSEEEEIRRVVPVIERLREELEIPLSIDTYKSDVARAALKAGACIVNDISGLTYDPKMIDVAREHEATVILMHILGTPKTMQLNPTYKDVVVEVRDFLEKQSSMARSGGISQIIVDPGVGFGKDLGHNLELIRHLGAFTRLGFPVLVGPSRKSFIGKILNLTVDQRLEGTAAAVTACILRGANIIRVHDVKEMKRVALVADALKTAEAGS